MLANDIQNTSSIIELAIYLLYGYVFILIEMNHLNLKLIIRRYTYCYTNEHKYYFEGRSQSYSATCSNYWFITTDLYNKYNSQLNVGTPGTKVGIPENVASYTWAANRHYSTYLFHSFSNSRTEVMVYGARKSGWYLIT